MDITLPIQSETLTADEIVEITGRSRRYEQVQWFKCNGWVYYKNATGAPVIGRLYARMKLAGVDLSLAAPQVYLPDFSHLS